MIKIYHEKEGGDNGDRDDLPIEFEAFAEEVVHSFQ